jgi:hypothetical protein
MWKAGPFASDEETRPAAALRGGLWESGVAGGGQEDKRTRSGRETLAAPDPHPHSRAVIGRQRTPHGTTVTHATADERHPVPVRAPAQEDVFQYP